MNSKSVYDKFKSLNKDNSLVCTKKDLDEFMMYGILLQSGKNYVTRDNKQINIDLIKTKELTFNINLQNLIYEADEIHQELGCNKIFFMTSRCYNKCKQKGLIINKNDRDYYRYFDKELWLVKIIN